MPAQTKYLSSGWKRFSKLMAAIFGGYFATMLLHLSIAKHAADDTPVLLTSTYSTFLVWCGFMVLVYFIRRAWVSWALLLSISTVGLMLILL